VVDVLGAHKHDVGYILAAYTISALLIRPFTGMAVDLWGRKWIYIISFGFFTVILAIYPLLQSFAMLLLLRFLHGFAWGVNSTSGLTAVVDIIPLNKRGRGIGYFGMSFTISMAIAPLIALYILSLAGFTAMFLVAAAFSFAGWILILFVRFPAIRIISEKTRMTWGRFIEKTSIPVALPQILFGMTYGSVISFITIYAKETGLEQTGQFFMVIAIGIFISRIFTGQVFDSKGPMVLMISGFLVSIGGFFLLAFLPNMTGFLLSAFLIGMGSGILMPTMTTMVNNMVGIERRGAANATISTAFDLGIGMGSLFLGVLSEAIGLRPMYFSCTLILLSGFLLWIFYVNRFYQEKRTALINSRD
jgi:MFS family permease